MHRWRHFNSKNRSKVGPRLARYLAPPQQSARKGPPGKHAIPIDRRIACSLRSNADTPGNVWTPDVDERALVGFKRAAVLKWQELKVCANTGVYRLLSAYPCNATYVVTFHGDRTQCGC